MDEYKRVKQAFEDAGFATGRFTLDKYGGCDCLSVYTPDAGKALLTTIDRYAEHKRQIFTGADDVVDCLHEFVQLVIEYRTKSDIFPSIMYFPHIQPEHGED